VKSRSTRKTSAKPGRQPTAAGRQEGFADGSPCDVPGKFFTEVGKSLPSSACNEQQQDVKDYAKHMMYEAVK